jgi:glycosyltransferase involved in cell wall biosynthesis
LPQMDVVGGVAAGWAGVPWILSERSAAVAYDRNMKNRLRERIAGRASAIVANSKGGRAFWESRVPDRVFRYVIPNIGPFQEIEEASPIEDETIGLAHGRRLILSVASFTPLKNVPRVVRAVARVANRIDCEAFLCGDGTDPRSIDEAIRAAGLGERVRLLGLRTDVWRLMHRADVLVSASVVEGQPNAVLEAMAAGCPIVLSDIPAHREVADETCALFVDPHSVDSIAEGIANALLDAKASRMRAERGCDRVRLSSARDIATMFEEVYESIRPMVRSRSEGSGACAG